MARMNEGFCRQTSELADALDWAFAPLDPDPSRAQAVNEEETHWAPCGPGWFDSSWLLHQGLEVTELGSVGLLEVALRALQMQSPPNENALHVPA